mgnify:CR=1 FL=1
MNRSGQLLGSVTQDWSILRPKFTVRNSSGEAVLRIEGPYCTSSCCGDIEFQVLTLETKTKVGKITKKWSGLEREIRYGSKPGFRSTGTTSTGKIGPAMLTLRNCAMPRSAGLSKTMPAPNVAPVASIRMSDLLVAVPEM